MRPHNHSPTALVSDQRERERERERETGGVERGNGLTSQLAKNPELKAYQCTACRQQGPDQTRVEGAALGPLSHSYPRPHR